MQLRCLSYTACATMHIKCLCHQTEVVVYNNIKLNRFLPTGVVCSMQEGTFALSELELAHVSRPPSGNRKRAYRW